MHSKLNHRNLKFFPKLLFKFNQRAYIKTLRIAKKYRTQFFIQKIYLNFYELCWLKLNVYHGNPFMKIFKNSILFAT